MRRSNRELLNTKPVPGGLLEDFLPHHSSHTFSTMRSDEERGGHLEESAALLEYSSSAAGQSEHRADHSANAEFHAQLLLDAYGSLGHARVSAHHHSLHPDGQFREGAEVDRQSADQSAKAQDKRAGQTEPLAAHVQHVHVHHE